MGVLLFKKRGYLSLAHGRRDIQTQGIFGKKIKIWNSEQTQCSRGCSTNTFVTHSFIQSLNLFKKYLHNILTPKPYKLGSYNFEGRFTSSHLLCVTRSKFFFLQNNEFSLLRVCYQPGLHYHIIWFSFALKHLIVFTTKLIIKYQFEHTLFYN